jgi:hypothetical protein
MLCTVLGSIFTLLTNQGRKRVPQIVKAKALAVLNRHPCFYRSRTQMISDENSG